MNKYIMVYSYSKLKLFENCPRAYKYRYIDKVKVDKPATIEQFTGKKVHETFEFLYSQIMKNKIPSLNYLLSKFDIGWKKTFNPHSLVINTDQNFHEKATECISNYYNSHKPFEKDRTVAVEKKIFKKFDNFSLIGFIDRLERSKNRLVIHDYKTSSSKYPDSFQMQIYHLCLDKHAPADYIWHYVYLNDIEKREGDLTDTESKLLSIISSIEKENEFKTNKSNFCNWCQFKEICSEC